MMGEGGGTADRVGGVVGEVAVEIERCRGNLAGSWPGNVAGSWSSRRKSELCEGCRNYSLRGSEREVQKQNKVHKQEREVQKQKKKCTNKSESATKEKVQKRNCTNLQPPLKMYLKAIPYTTM